MSGLECAFVGVLGRDAESRTSKAGKFYLKLNCRVGNGDDGQWVSVMLFGDLAQDLTAKAMLKGARIYVECNNLRIDEWTGQDGTKRTGLSAMSCTCGRARSATPSRSASAPRPTVRPRTTAAIFIPTPLGFEAMGDGTSSMD